MPDLQQSILDYLAENGETRSFDLVRATWRGKFGTVSFIYSIRNLMERRAVMKRREPAGCYTKVYYRISS